MSSKTQATATKEEAKPALVPKLRFPEFREMQGWDIEEVGDLLEESRTPSLLNDPSRRITVRLHLQGVEHREHRGTESTESTNNFCRKAGQFIYGKQNIHKGAFGIIPDQLNGFETSQDLPSFDFKHRCCPQWFYFNFASEAVYGPIELKMTGTGSKRLNEKTFLSLPIAVPSYSEQQKIAECLSSVDELMAAQARKVDALKTHKRGLMQQLFPRRNEDLELRSERTEPNASFSIQNSNFSIPSIRFPEFQNAGEWERVRLDEISRVIRGSSPRPQGDPRFFGGPVPRLMVQDVTRDGKWVTPRIDSLTEEGATMSRPCPAGTLTIVCSGVVGVVSFLAVDACIHDGFLALVDIDESRADKDFLFHTLSTLRNEFERGATHGGVFTNLTTQGIKEFVINCPDIPEQQRIATCLSSLDALITAETQKHEALKTHKKGLMQQLFPSPEEVEA